MNNKNIKLLVVDDEAVTVEVIGLILSNYPQYKYKAAFSGEEALELLDNYSPDIILLDVVMPDINGYELCRRIRSKDRHKFSKIIMISGLAMLEDRLKGYEAGADDYLAKPLVKKEFTAKLGVYSKLSRMEEVDSLKTTALNLLCHETRTPLNGIIMGCELLEETLAEIDGLPDKTNQYVRLVRESGEKIQNLVDKISRYYSVKEGEKKVKSIQTLTTVFSACSDRIIQSDKDLKLTCPWDTHIKFVTDWSLLQEAMVYVSDNAVNNSPVNGMIEINCHRNESKLIIQIRDEGTSMEPSVRERIFDSLFNADILHHGQGAGMNLAIAKGIIEDLGGDIVCEDNPGGGSLFVVSLENVAFL